MISKVISKYLERDDAQFLQKQLENAGVTSIVKRYGLPRFLGGMINYQVMIDPQDTETANNVVHNFNEKLKQRQMEINSALSTRCPGCGSENISIIAKNSIVKKIIYFGVTVHHCKDCHGKWFT